MTDRGLGIDSSSNVWWDCSREDAYPAPSATAASSPGCSKTSECRSDSIGMTVRIASESALRVQLAEGQPGLGDRRARLGGLPRGGPFSSTLRGLSFWDAFHG